MAKVMIKELEQFHPMFIEEPVLSEHLLDIADTLRATPTPIATGERMYSRWDVRAILASGAIDVLQPDPSHAGGITENRSLVTIVSE